MNLYILDDIQARKQILQISFYRSGKKFLNNLTLLQITIKSSGKMESATMDVVAEENQEECLGIQDQASGEVQVSVEAEVNHCNFSATRRAAYWRRNEACT